MTWAEIKELEKKMLELKASLRMLNREGRKVQAKVRITRSMFCREIELCKYEFQPFDPMIQDALSSNDDFEELESNSSSSDDNDSHVSSEEVSENVATFNLGGSDD